MKILTSGLSSKPQGTDQGGFTEFELTITRRQCSSLLDWTWSDSETLPKLC